MRSGTQLCQRSKPGGNKLQFVHENVFLADQHSFCEGTCFDAEEDPPLDREQNFDDEAWGTALSEVEAGREQGGVTGVCSLVGVFGGPKQLPPLDREHDFDDETGYSFVSNRSRTKTEVPRRINSSGVVLGKTTA
eukprot:1660840-Amphidinium_carterae.1